MHDPLDHVAEHGCCRIVWMEDFDNQLFFVDNCNVALIDRQIPRRDAARLLRDLLGLPCLCHDEREAC